MVMCYNFLIWPILEARESFKIFGSLFGRPIWRHQNILPRLNWPLSTQKTGYEINKNLEWLAQDGKDWEGAASDWRLDKSWSIVVSSSSLTSKLSLVSSFPTAWILQVIFDKINELFLQLKPKLCNWLLSIYVFLYDKLLQKQSIIIKKLHVLELYKNNPQIQSSDQDRYLSIP